MVVLCNAFSINMLNRRVGARNISFIPIPRVVAWALVIKENATCAIGHEDMARMVAIDLDMPEYAEEWAAIARTRPTVSAEDNSLIVAQYRGGRLPAGATELPPGIMIEYWYVYTTDLLLEDIFEKW